jgi:hypothetical protein
MSDYRIFFVGKIPVDFDVELALASPHNTAGMAMSLLGMVNFCFSMFFDHSS